MKLFLNSLSIGQEVNPLFGSLLQLPDEINAVNGDTFALFYNACILSPYQYYLRVTCDIGYNYSRYFYISTFDTTPLGSYPLKIEIVDSANEVVETATTIIHFKDAIQEPSALHHFWTIGDSLTENSTWTDEMMRRLTGTGGTPVGNGYTNISNHREGNGGKSWAWYVSTESPFWIGGQLDFEQYRIDNGLPVPKSINILMTWNDMATVRDEAGWNLWDNDVYTFIDAFKSDFPDCDVVMMSPQLPSINGGLGYNYGCIDSVNGTLSDYFSGIINAKKQGQIYQRICNEAGYENFRYLDTSLQFDNVNNMPQNDVGVNSRNSVKTEWIGTNGVHPDDSGYYQIADAGYRDFINNYCQ